MSLTENAAVQATSANALNRREFVGLSAAALAGVAALGNAAPALAEEASADAAASDEDGLTIPEVGTELAGFKVVDQHRIDYLDITCVRMEHVKTGAALVYAACEDTDRAFAIGFRTPAPDDKGIPHVFEHSTLCGSDKYPSPSLYFAMMSQTYNTYLNAGTYPTCTVYPASSLSEDQLYSYVDYLLNGVFHPTIMNDERPMMREAYRYELADRDSDITLTGTVYSEMQGAIGISQRGLYNLSKMLFPGSSVSNIAGGDPAVIPTMTHQDLIDFHNTYYHPSNAMISLYGKLDLEKFLTRIDEYLGEYEKADIVIDDPDYQPVEGFVQGSCTFPVEEGATTDPYAYYAFSLDGATAEELALAGNFVEALGTGASPLYSLAAERFPGAQVAVQLATDTMKVPCLMFVGMGEGVDDADAFKQLVDDVVAQILEQGVDSDALQAQCQQLRFSLGMTREESGLAASFSTGLVCDWGPTGDPDSYKATYDTMNQLESYVEQDGMTQFLRERLGGSQRSGLYVITGEPGGSEREAAELKQSLADMKAAMTDEQIDALVARTADFAAWTEENTQDSGIEAVKAVDVASLPEEGSNYTYQSEQVDGVTYNTCEVETGELVYFDLEFDTSFIPADKVLTYSMAAEFAAYMATKSYAAEEMQLLASQLMYDFSISPSYIQYAAGGYRPSCHVAGTFLKDQASDVFDFLDEILFNLDFSDADYLRSKVSEANLSENAYAEQMPEMFLNGLIPQRVEDGAEYCEHTTSGFTFSHWMRQVAAMGDDEFAQVMQDMQELWNQVARKENLIVGLAGTAEGIAAARERLDKTVERLDATSREAADYSQLEGLEGPVAVELNGSLSYNYLFLPLAKNGIEYDGRYLAVQKVVLDKVLMQVLRFQNGAYSADCNINEYFICVGSYRDPEYDKTYQVYEQLGELVDALELTQDDLDGYITSAFTSLATPKGPLSGAKQALSDALTGQATFADNQRYMADLKALTVEDFKQCASIFARLASEGERTCLAPASVIEEHAGDYNTVITDFVE